MTLATLADVLNPARAGGYAVGGLVCLGWEDMRAYADAAEAESLPLILQAGPSCRAHTPLPVLGQMFRHLADSVSVPVVAHLDHGYTMEECETALAAGFTSLMFDGSKLPLDENIAATKAVVDLAHGAGISCEGEIGFVGYAAGEASRGTDPGEAAIFARETGVDAMAISVGNVHLQENHEGGLDADRIAAIEAVTDVPLVIHGGSGVPVAERTRLARETAISKFNIGTELRLVFGRSLREVLANDPDRFDRVKILSDVEPAIREAARHALRTIGPA
ncbi:MAG: class II fructose-bisphosphate aldolase [Pseudomonadota bacterium]